MAEHEEDNALTNYRAVITPDAQLRAAVHAYHVLEEIWPARIAQRKATAEKQPEFFAALDAVVKTLDLLTEFEGDFRALARQCIEKRNAADAKRQSSGRNSALDRLRTGL